MYAGEMSEEQTKELFQYLMGETVEDRHGSPYKIKKAMNRSQAWQIIRFLQAIQATNETWELCECCHEIVSDEDGAYADEYAREAEYFFNDEALAKGGFYCSSCLSQYEIPYRQQEWIKDTEEKERCEHLPQNESPMEMIRRRYGVPAKRGAHVNWNRNLGRITSAKDHYLFVLLDGSKKPIKVHPLDLHYFVDGQLIPDRVWTERYDERMEAFLESMSGHIRITMRN